jgi:hypothetical protein
MTVVPVEPLLSDQHSDIVQRASRDGLFFDRTAHCRRRERYGHPNRGRVAFAGPISGRVVSVPVPDAVDDLEDEPLTLVTVTATIDPSDDEVASVDLVVAVTVRGEGEVAAAVLQLFDFESPHPVPPFDRLDELGDTEPFEVLLPLVAGRTAGLLVISTVSGDPERAAVGINEAWSLHQNLILCWLDPTEESFSAEQALLEREVAMSLNLQRWEETHVYWRPTTIY